MTDVLIALAFGVVFWFAIVPLLILIVFSLLDVVWRQDLGGFGKAIWVTIQLAVPGLGLFAYWLLRPKTLEVWAVPYRN
jgi:hypothetical protein